ncbi:hypothetical protein B9Z19DRAFT_479381 [Tuber borchii]|uniref:Uncharacterized protein n=1 Tax=Tuber borchii TaxID=42251 RepID=A0A2T7A3G2_TUBBO|nr:hypothetical protein B9Z19DRAFT_479381 [Tuber borchii]
MASPPPPPPLLLPAQDSINSRSAAADVSRVSPAPSQAPSSSSTSKVISSITTSASSLLSSLVHQDSTSINATLTSFSGSSGKVQSPPTAPSNSSSLFADPSHPALSNASSAATSAAFKSQPLSSPSSEIEFTLFSTDFTVPTCQNCNHPQHSVTNDGQAVIDLLSQPLCALALPLSDLSRIDASHPVVAEFVACDDPVDFLLTTSEYSEDVWGDLVGLFRQAKEEVKGKMKESQPPTTITRLRGVWSHLRTPKL